MKKRIAFIATLAMAIVMFSSCELFMLGNLFGGLVDYTTCYVENKTGKTVTVRVQQDPTNWTSDTDPIDVKFTLKANATKKKAFTAGGYFKVTIDGEQVIPNNTSADKHDYTTDGGDVYYYITQNSLLQLKQLAGEDYIYYLNSRTE